MLDPSKSLTQALRSLGRGADMDVRARRASVRRPVNVRVLYSIPGRKNGEAWALNLSAGGIRLVTEEPLELGEAMALRIEPNEEGSGLMGHGRVVWVKQCPDGFVTGIQFIERH